MVSPKHDLVDSDMEARVPYRRPSNITEDFSKSASIFILEVGIELSNSPSMGDVEGLGSLATLLTFFQLPGLPSSVSPTSTGWPKDEKSSLLEYFQLFQYQHRQMFVPPRQDAMQLCLRQPGHVTPASCVLHSAYQPFHLEYRAISQLSL